MTPSEIFGTTSGYGLGLFTGLISLIRRSRMFHPKGILLQASVEKVGPIDFPSQCMVRLSSAWWKHKMWRDALGISLRFETTQGIQDLLFVSFSKPWMTPIGPLITKYKNFFDNEYYAVSPFTVNGHKTFFKLVPQQQPDLKLNRNEIVLKALEHKSGTFRLLMKDYREEWVLIARIQLESLLDLDQEALRFNPFNTALGIHPKGFIHHLRIGSYQLSQMTRPKSATAGYLIPDKGSALPS